MPALKNPKHEAFAQEFVLTGNASEAWRRATGKTEGADKYAAEFGVIRGMAERIAEIQSEQASKSELSKEYLRNWCERIITAKPSAASEDSDICETVMTKMGPFTALCSKMAAFDRLAKLCGHFAPDKVEHSGTVGLEGLTEAVAAVFRK